MLSTSDKVLFKLSIYLKHKFEYLTDKETLILGTDPLFSCNY